jgi:hypothetical protein
VSPWNIDHIWIYVPKLPLNFFESCYLQYCWFTFSWEAKLSENFYPWIVCKWYRTHFLRCKRSTLWYKIKFQISEKSIFLIIEYYKSCIISLTWIVETFSCNYISRQYCDSFSEKTELYNTVIIILIVYYVRKFYIAPKMTCSKPIACS